MQSSRTWQSTKKLVNILEDAKRFRFRNIARYVHALASYINCPENQRGFECAGVCSHTPGRKNHSLPYFKIQEHWLASSVHLWEWEFQTAWNTYYFTVWKWCLIWQFDWWCRLWSVILHPPTPCISQQHVLLCNKNIKTSSLGYVQASCWRWLFNKYIQRIISMQQSSWSSAICKATDSLMVTALDCESTGF